MKILKRFLKENNVYTRIINYICPYGLKERGLYEKIRDYIYLCEYLTCDFRDILRLRAVIDPSYTKLGHEHWIKYIEPISYKLMEYYEKNVSVNILHYKIKIN